MNINQILLAAAIGEAMPLKFDTLPATEAEADATHFVCEAAGGANANEIGIGAGLSETNRTLTRFGTVGASSDGWRDVSAVSGFNITSAWADAFLRNASGFSFLWHMKNSTGAGAIAYLSSSSPETMSLLVFQAGIIGYTLSKYGINYQWHSSTANILPAADDFYFLYSVDYTNDLAFFGLSIGTAQPTKLSDFDQYAVSIATQTPIASAITLAANTFGIVGATAASGQGNTAFSFRSLTAKLGASVTLA